jgi:hypothetical protein
MCHLPSFQKFPGSFFWMHGSTVPEWPWSHTIIKEDNTGHRKLYLKISNYDFHFEVFEKDSKRPILNLNIWLRNWVESAGVYLWQLDVVLMNIVVGLIKVMCTESRTAHFKGTEKPSSTVLFYSIWSTSCSEW